MYGPPSPGRRGHRARFPGRIGDSGKYLENGIWHSWVRCEECDRPLQFDEGRWIAFEAELGAERMCHFDDVGNVHLHTPMECPQDWIFSVWDRDEHGVLR